jgi:hypothetical protein
VIEQPEKTLPKIAAWAQISVTDAIHCKMDDLIAQPVNALSAPEKHKWRRDNFDEISALLPRIAPLAVKLGYEINPQTGDFKIVKR